MKNSIIQSCLNISIKNIGGCLFTIVTDKYSLKKFYDFYTPAALPKIEHCFVTNETDITIIEKLAEIDGAMIISSKGKVLEYGATLKYHDNFIRPGKRHAFAKGTSKIKGLITILKSEEDNHVRVFKEGICITDIDAKTKLPESFENKLIELLNQPISQILISSGITLSLLPAALPYIITFHGAKFFVSKGFEPLKKLFRK